jgi:hypothetical protein
VDEPYRRFLMSLLVITCWVPKVNSNNELLREYVQRFQVFHWTTLLEICKTFSFISRDFFFIFGFLITNLLVTLKMWRQVVSVQIFIVYWLYSGICSREGFYLPDSCELTFANTLLLSNAAISLGNAFISLEISSSFLIFFSLFSFSLAWTFISLQIKEISGL